MVYFGALDSLQALNAVIVSQSLYALPASANKTILFIFALSFDTRETGEREREREMHLWPSMKIRDSFKTAYLKNLEWNLQRMSSQKAQSESASEKLLSTPRTVSPESNKPGIVVTLFWDLLMVLSCCFCCGVFEDDEE
ncbi:hypothetical protein Ancab_023503 [Ancistrocladus abbreviatus]